MDNKPAEQVDENGMESPKVVRVPDNVYRVFKEWSNIPDDEIIPHVTQIHDEAHKTFDYGCIGAYLFLHIYLPTYSYGPEIISRITGPEQAIYLDVGCCMAQDIRYLTTVGAPPTNVFGTDYQQGFLDLGHKLFRDSDRLKDQFFQCDLVGEHLPTSSKFAHLKGKFDIIHAANFLHLFDWETQVKVAKNLWWLLSEKKGSVIMGSQGGKEVAEEIESPHKRPGRSKKIFRHDKESFERMWKEVAGGEKNVKLDVMATEIETVVPGGLVLDRKSSLWESVRKGYKRIIFNVERV